MYYTGITFRVFNSNCFLPLVHFYAQIFLPKYMSEISVYPQKRYVKPLGHGFFIIRLMDCRVHIKYPVPAET